MLIIDRDIIVERVFISGWRNTVDFDPLEVYGNWSYVDAILMPLVEAVKRAVKPTTRVRFRVQCMRSGISVASMQQ